MLGQVSEHHAADDDGWQRPYRSPIEARDTHTLAYWFGTLTTRMFMFGHAAGMSPR